VRMLLKRLASEGRTVFVSSHLMSEMALTADHLVVIGRGRLIAEQPVAEFIAQSSGQHVLVRTPQPDRLAQALIESGATIAHRPDGALEVTGSSGPSIGDLAAGLRIAVHELTPQSASLEEAFMELTRDSVEFHGEGGDQPDVLAGVTAATPGDGTAGHVPQDLRP
jgi:ABC-2 type transport system ATP-binding protein